MLRGLEGRRIAVVAGSAEERAEVQKELTAAGAVVTELPGEGEEATWHSGMYAGLVLIGRSLDAAALPRVKQLVQEFLVGEKPVAALGVDADALALEESLVAVRGGDDPRAFAREVVRVFGERLEEHDVDEMSDQSFPASDPPAVNPGTAGPAADHQHGA